MTIFEAQAHASAGRVVLPRRPAHFREPSDMRWSKLVAVGPQFAARKVRVQGARAAGIRYEKRIHAALLAQYSNFYVPNPWFKFEDNYGLRWCQPDGLLIDAQNGQIIIIEVKHHHTGEAWWKLHKLYLPVVRDFFGERWTYRCLEIVRWYDARELFPMAKLCEIVHLAPPLPHVGVHILKPKAGAQP